MCANMRATLLVAAPVGTAHGVFEMHVLVVALALDAVGQTGLHAALRGDRMRTLGRHQRQDQRFQAAPLGADGGAQTGQTAADHQHIGMDDLHGAALIEAGT
jgi:hypothetical protein